MSVYFKAQGSCEPFEATIDEVSEIIESWEKNAQVILLGDFNGDVGFRGGSRGSRAPTPQGCKLTALFNRHGLTPLNMQPYASGPIETYEGYRCSSTLDYIVAPTLMLSEVSTCYVHKRCALNTSDHLPISAHLCISNISLLEDITVPKGRIKWKRLSAYNKFIQYQCVLEPLLEDISTRLGDSPKGPFDIDNAFNDLIRTIHEVSETLPHTKYKKNLKPFWNAHLSELKRKKVISYRQWVREGRPRDQDNKLYLLYKQDKKLFHKTIKRLSKQYENEEILSAVKSAELDRNSFWRLVSIAPKGQIKGVSAIKRKDEKVVHELPDALKVWVDQFSSIGRPKKSDNYDLEFFDNVTKQVADYNKSDEGDDFLDQQFTIEEVSSKAINTLHINKAPGYDEVTTEHLKYGGACLTELLCDLYNMVVKEEYIPLSFKCGVLVPLYKGKDTCIFDPNNYRGITLLPTFNKVLEISIWQRLKT